ncbi:MAG TPA: hypothetical protein VFU15_11150, partial [Bacteroidia bacterium]|nr:hypothetical protein [Bacteroidia bacterium]
MLKKYILIASVAFTCALNAQTPTVYPGMPQKTTDPKQQKPVYSGPSAAGDMKRDNGDFAGAIVEYNKEITKIDADAQRIAKLKTDYEKMSEFDRMNQNQDEATKNYPDWAKLYYGRAMANIGLGK